jgi:hypothetical protein
MPSSRATGSTDNQSHSSIEKTCEGKRTESILTMFDHLLVSVGARMHALYLELGRRRIDVMFLGIAPTGQGRDLGSESGGETRLRKRG